MRIVVLDTETTLRNKGDEAVGKSDRASPFHPENAIVQGGFLRPAFSDGTPDWYYLGTTIIDLPKMDLLVGHNIKFDMHYLQKYQDIKGWLKGGGRIWDTMAAEWILTGQESNFSSKGSLSLDGLCTKYGLPLKDNKIKEYWDAGIETENIPREELEAYLERDVRNTAEVFELQRQEAAEKGLLPLMYDMMESIIGTWMMEHNGMQYDKAACQEEMAAIEEKLLGEETHFNFNAFCYVSKKIDWNINSNAQVSALLFGGTLKYTAPVLTGEVYKTGKKKGEPKTKQQEYSVNVVGKFKSPNPLNKQGHYPVDNEVLAALPLNPYSAHVLTHRNLSKYLRTYLIGYSDCVWHDGRIRPRYNHGATSTGRLSCSKPNLQNASNHDDEDRN